MDNSTSLYSGLFRQADFSVIICERAQPNRVVYMNPGARVMLDPGLTVRELIGRGEVSLQQILKFSDNSAAERLMITLSMTGSVSGFGADILSFDGKTIPVEISANGAGTPDEAVFVIYISPARRTRDGERQALDKIKIMSLIHNAVYNTHDTDEAINRVLSIAGRFTGAARAYVFEDLGNEFTRNTFEWCAEGVMPAIQDLQNLRKDSYNYESIISSGIFLGNDVTQLPQIDREILEAQGITALAIVPMHADEGAIGYVGFDATDGPHDWSEHDISLLQSVANVLVSLIMRRRAQSSATLSLGIFKTIAGAIDSVIYVNRPDSYEITFVNDKLAQSIGLTAGDCVGKKCWEVLQAGMNGPCPFCPMPKLKLGEEHAWEHKNTINGKWYLVRDKLIRWIDGTDVHMEIATEITAQKRQEEQLRYIASFDAMTGSYNREWGCTMMQNLILETSLTSSLPLCLCFLDIDNLKLTNDTFGHEAGDELIVNVVSAVRRGVRKSDLIVRWGGDEFIVLVQCTREVGERLMTSALSTLKELNTVNALPYPLSFSYGIVEFVPNDGTILEEIVSTADKLMYEQKLSKKSSGECACELGRGQDNL